jgi:hypothetical protein
MVLNNSVVFQGNYFQKPPWPESATKSYRPSHCRLSAKLVPTFADIRCHVVSVTSLRPYSWFSRPDPLLFLPSSSSVALKRLSGPRSRPTTCQEIWQRCESNPDFWIYSRELWPLDHRGDQLYSRGREDPVRDPLLLRKCGSTGNRTHTSGSVARNSDH